MLFKKKTTKYFYLWQLHVCDSIHDSDRNDTKYRFNVKEQAAEAKRSNREEHPVYITLCKPLFDGGVGIGGNFHLSFRSSCIKWRGLSGTVACTYRTSAVRDSTAELVQPECRQPKEADGN